MTSVNLRFPLRALLGCAAVFSLAACASEPTAVRDRTAVDAATKFHDLAEDAVRAGADEEVVRSFRNLGLVVGMNGRVSPVTIVIDGTARAFYATAQQLEFRPPPCGINELCAALPALRSVIAWQRDDPRRVVQLTAVMGALDIAQQVNGWPGSDFFRMATLSYFDGAGGVFLGTGGSQRIGDPVASDVSCYSITASALVADSPVEFGGCTRAEFIASFAGTLAPSPIVVRNNTASGSHSISMSSQAIHGARVILETRRLEACPDCGGSYPGGPFPPINLRGGVLRSDLVAEASGGDLTFTFRVTNGVVGTTDLRFASGQQFDVQVYRMDGTPVWTWSADKLFTQARGSRGLAAGASATYTARWTPTAKGELYAVARLVSDSHSAQSTTRFVVP